MFSLDFMWALVGCALLLKLAEGGPFYNWLLSGKFLSHLKQVHQGLGHSHIKFFFHMIHSLYWILLSLITINCHVRYIKSFLFFVDFFFFFFFVIFKYHNFWCVRNENYKVVINDNNLRSDCQKTDVALPCCGRKTCFVVVVFFILFSGPLSSLSPFRYFWKCIWGSLMKPY